MNSLHEPIDDLADNMGESQGELFEESNKSDNDDLEIEWLEETEDNVEVQDDFIIEKTGVPEALNEMDIQARGQHICGMCHKSFQYSSQLRIHIEAHGSRNYKCTYPICKKSYKHEKHLDDHMKQKHGFKK